jgi:hypothetical protein
MLKSFVVFHPKKTSRNDLIMKMFMWISPEDLMARNIVDLFAITHTRFGDSFTCFTDRLALTSFKLSISMPARREHSAADKTTPKLFE